MCAVVNMNVIKQKRKELGISQRELSEKLGTSQQTISRIEKSDVENIPSSLLIKLADIFQIPVDFLIRGDKSDLFSTKGDETQAENMLKRQTGDKSDKNSNM